MLLLVVDRGHHEFCSYDVYYHGFDNIYLWRRSFVIVNHFSFHSRLDCRIDNTCATCNLVWWIEFDIESTFSTLSLTNFIRSYRVWEPHYFANREIRSVSIVFALFLFSFSFLCENILQSAHPLLLLYNTTNSDANSIYLYVSKYFTLFLNDFFFVGWQDHITFRDSTLSFVDSLSTYKDVILFSRFRKRISGEAIGQK